MSAILDHARSMIAYNHWANERILNAAAGLSLEDFAAVSGRLAHTVATQMYWHGNWTAAELDDPAPGGIEGEYARDDITSWYLKSDADLEVFAGRLTDEEWERTEAWWKRWGYDATAPVGQTVFQVIYHGIQHRAEVAVKLTERGASPGEMDYLVFLQESAGAA